MTILAQTTSADVIAGITPVLQAIGIPGVVTLVLGYTFRKLYYWVTKFWADHAWPYIEKAIQAYLSRQATMEECTKQLTEKTIEIQQQVLTILLEMKKDFPGLCKNRDQSQH